MDIRNQSEILIPKNCTRTANAQITDKSTTATYYGPGELVITDTKGTVLNNTTALKSVSEIMFHIRNASGESGQHISLRGDEITSYTSRLFKLAQPQVTVVDITQFSLTNFTYRLQLTSDKVPCYGQQPYRTSVHITVGETAYASKAALATAFAAKINEFYNTGNTDRSTFKLSAAVEQTDKLVITSIDQDSDGLLFQVDPQLFSVSADGFEATIVDNKTGAISYSSVTKDAWERGRGTYELVQEIEKTGRGFVQNRYGRVLQPYYPLALDYDTSVLGKFEADGTTVKRYDEVTIGWQRTRRTVGGDHTHQGVITIFLPVEDNTTSQVNGTDTSSILKVLNKYIVTEYGIGTAITLSTP